MDGAAVVVIVKEWQTLAAGLLAFFPAVIAGVLLFRQIRQSDRQEAERQRRRLLAARATMTYTLDQIIDYAKLEAKGLSNVYTTDWTQTILPSSPSRPEIIFRHRPRPPEVIAAFERIIEASSAADIANRMADILHLIQLYCARVQRLDGKRLGDASNYDISCRFYDLAKLYANTERAYDYGRRKTENIAAVTYRDITKALCDIDLPDGAYGAIREDLEKEYPPTPEDREKLPADDIIDD